MRRSSPTYPDPNGGPPTRGFWHAARFLLLGLALIWAGIWILFPHKAVGPKLVMMFGFGVAYVVFVAVPLAALTERLDIRRYCAARGFRIVRFENRGVVYMDGDVKRYSRWPEDFRT